ncbi:MAG TPA: hypothetical protein VE258_18860, partial [Ktedonobacterales bacterium]|nr:hypothetical protein [Ktedonobacterales bacterium]
MIGELAETQRRLAAAEAALAEERRNLALAEEALERERHRADAATATMGATQQRGAPTPSPSAPSSPERQGTSHKERGGQQAERADRPRDDGDTASRSTLPGLGTMGNMGSLAGLGNLAGAEFFAASQRMVQAALHNPGLALQQSSKFVDEMTRIVTGQSKIAPDPKDKRFEDPAWTTNPVYKGFLQTYLLWRQSLNNLVDHANLPPKDADRARFALSLTRQHAPASERKQYLQRTPPRIAVA